MQNYPQQFANYRPYNLPYGNQQIYYKTLPVMSKNEINNITVDFNGSPTYFHNQATNEIYIKQFDIRTGITSTQRFVKAEHDSKPAETIKQDEGINTLKNDLTALNDRLSGLENMLNDLKEQKGGKNVK